MPVVFRPAARVGRLLRTLVVGAALAPAAAVAQPYSSLTFFGDSYVDTGNLFQGTGGLLPPSPPYFNGRYSNGLVFTDYVAASLGRPGDAAPSIIARAASGNYAVAGARTIGDLPGPPGTQAQIAAYLTRPGATPGTLTDPTGLYTLFVGGNDLRDAGALADPAARQAAAAAAAGRVVAQAGALAAAGARNVLLFSLQSPGVTPEALAVPGRPAILDQLTATFNSTLAAGILGLQQAAPGATFLNFRLDNLFANILIDAREGGTRYGLTNLTTPCLAPFAPPGAPSCDASVFTDDLHPTTRTHALIGSSIATYVTTGRNVAVIPEPATVALVAGGLAGVAAVARRRRAA